MKTFAKGSVPDSFCKFLHKIVEFAVGQVKEFKRTVRESPEKF